MDKFDAYFQRADLDRDGRISGAEAVSFFQGSNLSQQVLAQIWMHADQAHTGFLGRKEFYNALKLVTVAQSKRDLTPDIVKAALYGPAAAKIPAPQINLAAIPSPQISSMAAAPAPQVSVSSPQQMNASPASQISMAAPASSQHPGFRGQTAPNANMNQQYFPSQKNQFSRAPQIMPVVSSSQPPSTNISSEGLVGRSVGAPVGVAAPYRGVGPLTPSTAPIPQNILPTSSSPAAKDAKASIVSVNGFPSDTFFGDDAFSAKPSPAVKQDSLAPTYSTTSRSASSAALPPHPPVKSGSVDSLQSAFRMQTPDGQIQRTQSLTNPNQQGLAQCSSFGSSRNSVGVVNSASNQSLASWPRMTPSDVQKYTKVFVEVDTDRDGKITGEQARNLFLSWRLPREVLKQVWDLSDQDNDSMLSLKEFCIALYLMERFREGRPLPAVLPNNILSDETLRPNASYGNANSGTTPGGLRPQQMMPASRPSAPATGFRPPLQVSASHLDSPLQQSHPQNSRVPMMENPLTSHHSHAEQNSEFQAATPTEKKVEAMENVILDSREKVEFYRTKMQDLVLYKSRCDNRLNEITERASADKREAESLAKKYEEKYKQVAEIASKLAIEEAKFCEIQERKTELHQAILKIEQGGSADGILQVRADRIQSDVEELMKVLAEFCKKHGLDVMSSSLIELPIGWQRGIQEGSAEWDEDWDKFEDEGFSFAADGSLGGQNILSSPKQTSKSLSKSEDKSEKSLGTGESAYAQSEDELTSSPLGSPDKTTLDSPFQEFSDTHSRKSTEADVDNHGNFVEPSWGTFDNNDDTDSVWGFNPASTKDSVLERPRENYFFGSGDPSSDQMSSESPSADSMFQKKSPFTFADSVPGTPASRAGNSPRYSEAGDHFFDNYSRFDSFSMHEGGSAAPGAFTRFDSINSSSDFGHSKGYTSSPGRETFTRFDSINSSRDFGHSKQSSPGRETFTRFDSINSSRGFTFDETDPFGSTGPFKVSSESGTPKNSENWRSF